MLSFSKENLFFNIAAIVPSPAGRVSSGQAFVSGTAHGGRLRLAELFLDLVAIAM